MLRMKTSLKNEKGQILVIVAASMFVLLVVIGLAIDSTLLYLNYARLKRAVDAAAIAAANDFKRGSSLARMKEAAYEILHIHEVNTSDVDIKIYMCNDPLQAGNPDTYLQTEVPDFYSKCPTATQAPRKMIYLRAFEKSRTYFVSLLGIQNIPITTNAIAEAAPIDLVIVLDTSGSMGLLPVDQSHCNPCQPLAAAKVAAKALIDTLYEGYDRVAVVNFDVAAHTRYSFTNADASGLTGAKNAIDSSVLLRTDPPMGQSFWASNPVIGFPSFVGLLNPINPEDRDNDGLDADGSITCTLDTGTGAGRWDSTRNIPCDDSTVIDAFDWNNDFTFQGTTSETCTTASSDNCGSKVWMNTNGNPMTIPSTCSGCGIREATANLTTGARPSAVWVIIFLSDGTANMTDTFATYPYVSSTGLGISSSYKNGFCGGQIDTNTDDNTDNASAAVGQKKLGFNYWDTTCIDLYPTERWCINAVENTCPPGSYWRNPAVTGQKVSPPYGPEDYARDMTDRAALRSSTNTNERMGNDIAIYTVGFGDGVLFVHPNAPNSDRTNCNLADTTHQTACPGANLLRYMASVGDDGDRTTDPCTGRGAKESCGQYYFAQAAQDLLPIFQDIASRIYTKIAE